MSADSANRRTIAGEPAILTVRVTPRAGRTAIAGTRGNALLVKVSAAPVGGAANDALIAFLAETFDRPKRDVTIVAGHTSRDKRVAIAGLSDEALHQRVSAILAKPSRRT